MALEECSLKRQMTPEDVLEVFIHLQGMFGSTRPEDVLRFDMSITQWQSELELYNDTCWNERKWLWRFVMDFFRVSIPYGTWKSVVKPEGKRTVRELCELIASKAMVEEIKPLSILGKPCLPAGAFLAVRNSLTDAGIDTTDLRPSTRLEPLLRKHGELFEREMRKLAPGKLPSLETKGHPLAIITQSMIGIGLLTLFAMIPGAFVSEYFGLPGLNAVCLGSLVMIAIGVIGAYATGSLRPRQARLGELQTIRDVCCAILPENKEKPLRRFSL